MDVREWRFLHFLDGAQQYARVALNPDVTDVRVKRRKLHQKPPFSHADLDVDGMFAAEKFLPVPLVLGGILYTKGAVFDNFVRARDIS
jgi:hypothetical protein